MARKKEKLTIKQCLTKRHHTQRKPHQTSHPSPPTPYPDHPPPRPLALHAKPPHHPQIPHVPRTFHEVQPRLRGREAVLLPVRLLTIYVVDAAVERVGAEDGRVQRAPGHGVGP